MGLFGGATRMGIGLTVSLIDNFSNRAQAVNANMRNMATQAQAITTQQAAAMTMAGATLAAGGAAIVGGYAAMVKSASEYERTVAGVRAVTRGQVTDMGLVDAKMREVARNTTHTLRQVASAGQFMGMAGVSREDIITTLPAFAALAEATGHQLQGKGGAADIGTNIMKSFRIQAEDSQRVVDILAKGTVSANTNLFDLGEAIKYTAATAMDLNVGLEETTAMIMTMGNAGIQASMAGTAVENMLRYMTTATSARATKGDIWGLSQLGLSPSDLKDASGNLKPIYQILKLMRDASRDMGTVQRQTVFQEIFGVRGKRAGSLLIRALEDYKGFLKELQDVEPGFASAVAAERIDTIHGDLKLIASAWSDLEVVATRALEAIVRPLLWVVRYLVIGLSKLADIPIIGPLIIGTLVSIGAALAVVGSGLVVLGSMAFLYNQITVAVGALTAAQTANTASAVTSWGIRMTMARAYLRTLWAIFTAENAAAAYRAVVPGATGRGVAQAVGTGALSGFQRAVFWVGRSLRFLARGVMGLLRGFIWPVLTAIAGVIAPVLGFAAAAIATVGALWLLHKGVTALVNSVFDPDRGKNDWDTSQSQAISVRAYLDNPDAFDKNKVHIRHEASGELQATRETTQTPKGDTWINLIIDGNEAMTKKIEEGGEDIYHELGE